LIGDDAIVHEATHDSQHISIEEKLQFETLGLKGHRQKMAMWAAVRSLAVEIRLQSRPERVPAPVN
jgi:hypothetical protein